MTHARDFAKGILFVATLAFQTSTIASATSLAPPAGYSSSQLIFEDQFTSATLDTTKWNPWMGTDNYGRWGDLGLLPNPYSAVSNCANNNCLTASFYNLEYEDLYSYGYSTSTAGIHLTGSGHLAEFCNPSSRFSSFGYSWACSTITTYSHAYLPATGGYVQWHAKMPDSRYGAWAGLWMLDPNSSNEIDIQESGYLLGSTSPNQVMAMNVHTSGNFQQHVDTGVDLSAAYHTYGIQYLPGKSIKMYLDGNLMTTFTSSIPSVQYGLIISNTMANSNASGWHTVADPVNHPGPFEYDIDDVQIYSGMPSTTTDTTPPSAPTGLATTMVTPVEVDLAWTASTDPDSAVAGYKIFRNGAQIGTSATPSYADTSVVANTSYGYQAEAYDPTGNTSAASLTLNVTTPNFALGAAVNTATNTPIKARAGRGQTACIQPAGVNGTISSGLQTVGGAVWWFVEFVSGCSGWAQQSNLTLN